VRFPQLPYHFPAPFHLVWLQKEQITIKQFELRIDMYLCLRAKWCHVHQFQQTQIMIVLYCCRQIFKQKLVSGILDKLTTSLTLRVIYRKQRRLSSNCDEREVVRHLFIKQKISMKTIPNLPQYISLKLRPTPNNDFPHRRIIRLYPTPNNDFPRRRIIRLRWNKKTQIITATYLLLRSLHQISLALVGRFHNIFIRNVSFVKI